MPFGIAAAGIGAAGSIIGSQLNKPQSAQQTSVQTPENAAGVTYGQDQATNIYHNQNGQYYTGNFVAGLNGDQNAAINNSNAWTNGLGGQMPTNVANASTGLLGAGENYVTNANNMASNGIAGPNSGLMGTLSGYGTGTMSASGPTSGLSSALNSSAINGANALNNFTSGQENAAQRASGDNTGQIVNDANQYVNNSQVQSALNSTNAAINQTLTEQTLPQLNSAAANNGNLNSSRAGMEAGMARQGAATAEGQADAAILNNAYNTGVGAASSNYATNLSGQIAANSAGAGAANTTAQGVGNQQIGVNEFNASNQVNAANAGLSQGLNYEMGNANTQLAANGQLGSATGLGITGATAAGNLAAQNYGQAAAAGGLEQTGAQENLTNAYDQYQEQMQQPWQTLDNYMAVQQANAGNTTTSSGTQTPASNVASQALGGAAAGYGLYQNYVNANGQPVSQSSNPIYYNPYASGFSPNVNPYTGGY